MLKTIANLNKSNRLIFDLGVILLSSILVLLPIFINGIPDSQDIPQQYQFAQTFYNSIINGEFYPSWAVSPNYGYGDVSVRFYPPLAYFILSFFRSVSGNWYDASLLFFVFIYFLSGVGIYLFAREKFSENASLFGAFVYIFLPYHVMQIYIGAVFSEFTAMAILPFCFLFITRVCQKGRLIDILGLSFFYGLLTITHLPTILTASLTFTIFGLISIKRLNFIQTFLKLSLAVFLGLILSSFYWVRMVSEMDFLKHNTEAFISGIYSYKAQFILSYFFYPFFEVYYVTPKALMNVIGILTVGVLASFYLLYYSKAKRTPEYPSITNVTIAAGFALFMAVPLSTWVWELFPILQKIQFPFRWLTLVTLGTAFVAAAGFEAAVENLNTPKRYLSTLAIGLFLICFPYTYFRMMTPILTYPKDYLAQVSDGFRKMPSYECWWAIWTPVDKSAASGLPRPKLLPAQVVLYERNHEVRNWSSYEKLFTIEAGEPGQATLALMFYPHWKAIVNGQPVEVTPTDTGLISFPISGERSEVRVFFQEPQRIIYSYYLSGAAWIIMLGLFSFYLISYLRNRQPHKQNAE